MLEKSSNKFLKRRLDYEYCSCDEPTSIETKKHLVD